MGCSRRTTFTQFVIHMGLGPALLCLLLLLITASSESAHARDVSSLSSNTLPVNDIAKPDSNVEVCTYTVTTVTGKRAGAGTSSVISLRLENKKGDSVYFSELDNGKRHFQRGHTDKFIMLGSCVIDLCKITLYTDDSWDFGAWFVETVSYSVDIPTGPDHRTWEVHQWLPRDDDAAELFYVVNDCNSEELD